MDAQFRRPRRVLLAVEQDNGEAFVYELHGMVTIGAVEIEWSFNEWSSWCNTAGSAVPPRIRCEIDATTMLVRHVPASDYFEEQPEIAPPMRALDP